MAKDKPGEMTPGQKRTSAAREANTRRKHERWAEEMRRYGWTVQKPEESPRSE